MPKTPNAGSTAKGGILGRRKRVLPEPACYVTMWRKDANGRPVQVRCLLSEARKPASETALADRENGPLKSGRNAGVLGARKSPATPPSHCRYCGAASAYPWGAPQICLRCENLRDRHEAAAEGDDKLYLRVQRTLANRERAAAAERFAKHGPGRLEREGPALKVSEAIDKAKRAARANVRRRAAGAPGRSGRTPRSRSSDESTGIESHKRRAGSPIQQSPLAISLNLAKPVPGTSREQAPLRIGRERPLPDDYSI
jgi:hypothetical protein